MPMTQEAIRQSYESTWKSKSESAGAEAISYSSPIEDAVLYPLYRQLIEDLKLLPASARVLDVGSGSGRWIRFFLEHFSPSRLVGIDYTQASVELLKRSFPQSAEPGGRLAFQLASITDRKIELGGPFDLINVANVLFHIPEPDLFANALKNLSRHLDEGGRIVTTEYLPRTSMRTEWMLVRSRYEFEATCRAAGLRIIAIRASSIFSNDPMGLDGPDSGTRGHFHRVRAMIDALGRATRDPAGTRFTVEFISEIERAILAFCRERIADIDMPSQKLVVLARA